MRRLALRRLGLGLALLAAGVVGLGSGSARATALSYRFVSSVSISFERGYEPAFTGCLISGRDASGVLPPCQPGVESIQLVRPLGPILLDPTAVAPWPRSGAIFSIVDPTLGAVEISSELPGRTLVYPRPIPVIPELLPGFDDLLAGGSARFGRRTFVWHDEDGNVIGGGERARLPRPRLVEPTDPFLPLDPDLAQATWNVFSFLITTSCVRVEHPACFDPNRPLGADHCSFNAPQLCSSLRDFVSPRLAIALEIERLRIKTRRGSSRARLSGRFDAEGLRFESGFFTVAVGRVVARIPLDEFRRRGRNLFWAGRGDVRAVALSAGGHFRISIQGVDPQALEGDPLPVVLQIGAGLAAARVPLD